ncbi:unnamed protein product [Gadus morhua 'NCC']
MRRIDDQDWRLSRGRITEQHQGHPGDQADSGVKTGRMVFEEGGSTSPHLEIRSLSRLRRYPALRLWLPLVYARLPLRPVGIPCVLPGAPLMVLPRLWCVPLLVLPGHTIGSQSQGRPRGRGRPGPGGSASSVHHCTLNQTWLPLLDSLPLFQRQMMEKYFTPVYRPPTQEEMRKPKNHHHYPNDQPQHHPHAHAHQAYHSPDDQPHHRPRPDHESLGYANLVGTDENTDDSQAHHQNHHRRPRHAEHLHENLPHDYHQPPHPLYQPHASHESEIQNPQLTRVTLSRASSSSLSSSSSSSSLFSSYSWKTEPSEPLSNRPPQRPHHSLSCSNILEVRTGFRQDGGSEPLVFATVTRGAPEAPPHDRAAGHSRRNERARGSLPDQSHSDEGLLQTSEDEVEAGRRRRVAPPLHGALYKTASLGRSLAFSEENLVLGASGRPRRAGFTNQIPSKGILKNREPHPDIRKARSMEVLSPRVANGQGKGREKGKGAGRADIQTARESFVKGKMQFSAFLDEITKQVISPSNLNSLGVNQGKAPGETTGPAPGARGPGAAKPQLPVKKHRESSGEEREQHHKPPATQDRREPRGNFPSHHSPHPDQPNPTS